MANLEESEPQNVTCNVNNRSTSTLGSHFCIQLIIFADSTNTISGKITSGIGGIPLQSPLFGGFPSGGWSHGNILKTQHVVMVLMFVLGFFLNSCSLYCFLFDYLTLKLIIVDLS